MESLSVPSEVFEPKPPKCTNYMRDAFCLAAKNGDYKLLYRMAKEFSDINFSDSFGFTALHYACKNGDFEIVKFLLGNGASLHSKDANCVTCLHMAAKADHPRIVRLLLMMGAKIDAMTANHLKPIDYTRFNSETWKILYQAATGEMPRYDDLLEPLNVPFVPDQALNIAKSALNAKTDKKGKKGKKGGKKGKKKKK
ncbi:hypothetical protein Ciccas_005919 [Cichlidogyrus casuarinus]|uniref:Ankyrin repeat domain-containing protein n=1 Tax=Cichlidogyrus casuarinus TaxID=1844966 RepID=A0ABD2Q7L6_9PLAT